MSRDLSVNSTTSETQLQMIRGKTELQGHYAGVRSVDSCVETKHGELNLPATMSTTTLF
jgi:hypothetical protein